MGAEIMSVHSVFNIEGYVGNPIAVEIPTNLAVIVKNDFDTQKFKVSLAEHQRRSAKLHSVASKSGASIEGFNTTIKNICERGKKLKPFNVGIIRVLKYGDAKWMAITPLRSFLTRGVEGYTTEQLVGRYCHFFEEQAKDFGDLFYHIVERQNCLTDYSNELLKRDVFYLAKRDYLDGLITSADASLESKVESCVQISDLAKKAVVNRYGIKQEEVADARKVVDGLMVENGKATDEIDGLLRWCCGMKNVLALAKERMDNYGLHLGQTLVTYMQVTSLQRGFKETNNAITGLVGVMTAAQVTADNGLNEVIDFVKKNGVYTKPFEHGKLI